MVPWNDGSGNVPRSGRAAVQLVQKRRDGKADDVDVWAAAYEWHRGQLASLWHQLHERPQRYERVEMGVPFEGLATMLFGAVVFPALPDYPKSPRSRWWLTPREREYLETCLSDNAPRTADPAFRKEEVVTCLKDARTYAFMLAQFMTNFAGYGLSWMLPTVTTHLGFAGLPRNQLFNIPPAAGSVPGVIFAGWFLKRAYVPRPAFLILSGAVMLVFFILLAVLKNNVGIYVSVTFGSTFYAIWFIPFWAWRSATLKDTTGAAFGLAFQNCVGQQLFQRKFANNGYKTPVAVCAGATAGAFLASWWAWWLTRHVESDVMRIRRRSARERFKRTMTLRRAGAEGSLQRGPDE